MSRLLKIIIMSVVFSFLSTSVFASSGVNSGVNKVTLLNNTPGKLVLRFSNVDRFPITNRKVLRIAPNSSAVVSLNRARLKAAKDGCNLNINRRGVKGNFYLNIAFVKGSGNKITFTERIMPAGYSYSWKKVKGVNLSLAVCTDKYHSRHNTCFKN